MQSLLLQTALEVQRKYKAAFNPNWILGKCALSSNETFAKFIKYSQNNLLNKAVVRKKKKDMN